tara:strand:+ start:327 stop:1076 length:750 start_codon:yes stop_codon:yes gene_type:complete
MKGIVKLKNEDKVGKIHFFHPKGNSLPTIIINSLVDCLHKAENDPNINVIILESGGSSTFCSGASLSELKLVNNIESGTAFFMGFAKLLNTIREMSKFVLARVQGKLVGGGVGLVSACDYAFATEKASIKLSELSIGLGPYVIEPAVTRKIGNTAFTQLSIDSSNWKSANWGMEKGLYAHLSPDIDSMDDALNHKAQLIASYTPEACRQLRKLHWKNTQHWETLLPENAKITAQLSLSEYSQNLMKSTN